MNSMMCSWVLENDSGDRRRGLSDKEVRLLSAMSSGDVLAAWRGARGGTSNDGDDGAVDDGEALIIAVHLAKEELWGKTLKLQFRWRLGFGGEGSWGVEMRGKR